MNPASFRIFSPGVKMIGGFVVGFRTPCLVFSDAKLMVMFMAAVSSATKSRDENSRRRCALVWHARRRLPYRCVAYQRNGSYFPLSVHNLALWLHYGGGHLSAIRFRRGRIITIAFFVTKNARAPKRSKTFSPLRVRFRCVHNGHETREWPIETNVDR